MFFFNIDNFFDDPDGYRNIQLPLLILVLLNLLFALKICCFGGSIPLEKGGKWIIAMIVIGSLAIATYYMIGRFFDAIYILKGPLNVFGALFQYIAITLKLLSLLRCSSALTTSGDGINNETTRKNEFLFNRFLKWTTSIITIVSTIYSIFFVAIFLLAKYIVGYRSSEEYKKWGFYFKHETAMRTINAFFPFLFLIWMLFLCTAVIIRLWIISKERSLKEGEEEEEEEQQQEQIKERSKWMQILTLFLALGFILQIIFFTFVADATVDYLNNTQKAEYYTDTVYYEGRWVVLRYPNNTKEDRIVTLQYPLYWIPLQLMIFVVLLSYNFLKLRKEEESEKNDNSETETSSDVLQNNNDVENII